MYAPWLQNQVDDEGMRQARGERERRLENARQSRARDGTGAAELHGEGLASELGGGVMRLSSRVVDAPATAEEHARVEISWANAGGNLAVEKKTRGGSTWTPIARNAKSPVFDNDAEVGEALYRVKNGGNVIAQVGVLVESKDQQSANVVVLAGLAAALAAVGAFGLTLDAIPKV